MHEVKKNRSKKNSLIQKGDVMKKKSNKDELAAATTCLRRLAEFSVAGGRRRLAKFGVRGGRRNQPHIRGNWNHRSAAAGGIPAMGSIGSNKPDCSM